MHLNIILPSTPGFPSGSFPQLSHQNPVHPSPPPVHVTCPSHLILLYLVTRIIFEKGYRLLRSSSCSLLYSPDSSSFLGPHSLPSTLFSKPISLHSSFNVSYHVSHHYNTTGKSIALFCRLFAYAKSTF